MKIGKERKKNTKKKEGLKKKRRNVESRELVLQAFDMYHCVSCISLQ